MAILDAEDTKRLANWYRDELTYLAQIGKAVAVGNREKAMDLIGERRDMVGAQIYRLADAVGVTGRTPPTQDHEEGEGV